MKLHGEMEPQKALGAGGKSLKYSPLYTRSMSIQAIRTSYKPKSRMSWTKNDEAFEGYFRFVRDDGRGCVQTNQDLGRRFKGVFLDKVYADNYRGNKDLKKEGFYPVLHKFLTKRQNWGTDFLFRGLANFMPCLMEWTKDILAQHGDTLRRADIYGLVAASCFPYAINSNIWRAFCELWGPLTNTLHHAGGELGISLNDLKQIAGVSILGEPYEEFLPPNEILLEGTKYPPTVLELLRVHAMLHKYLGRDMIQWADWLEHFFRGEQRIVAYGELPGSRTRGQMFNAAQPGSSKDAIQETTPPSLSVSREGRLAAFISLLLCRFVFPHGPPVIRPGTFVMACFIANGRKVSLAPAVLGHIYHGLNEMATHATHPGRADPSFGLHFVIGWIAEYFPCVYRSRPADEFPADYPPLVRYAGLRGVGLDGKPHSIHQARLILRRSMYVSYRAVSFGDEIDAYRVDADDASDLDFERLLCIRSCVLPVRIGGMLSMEPYYPNRFARQFGFDQGVPSNSLLFNLLHRTRKSLSDIAHCYTQLFIRNTGVGFYIPRSYNQGNCTANYCRWWVAISAPYLSQSLHKVNVTMTRKESQIRENIFVITDMKRVINGLQGAVMVSNEESLSSSESLCPPVFISPSNKRSGMESSPSDDDVNFKRKRKKESAKPRESDFNIDKVNSELIHDSVFPIDEAQGNDIPISSSSQHVETNKGTPPIASSEVVSPSLDDLFPVSVKEYARQAVVDCLRDIVGTISKAQAVPGLSSLKDDVSGDLEALMTYARAAKVDENIMSWFVSQVHKFLEGAHAAAELAATINANSLDQISAEVSVCEAELASLESKLSQWGAESLAVKRRGEKILVLKAELQQKEDDLAADKVILEKRRSDLEQLIHSQKKKREDLEEHKVKCEEINLKEESNRNIAESLNSFIASV